MYFDSSVIFNISLKWSQVLWATDYGLRHVAILHCDDVGSALHSGDDTCAALESAVGHAHLLSAIDDDGDSVPHFVGMEHSTDEETAALGLAATQD
jgi:hypothetical protein